MVGLAGASSVLTPLRALAPLGVKGACTGLALANTALTKSAACLRPEPPPTHTQPGPPRGLFLVPSPPPPPGVACCTCECPRGGPALWPALRSARSARQGSHREDRRTPWVQPRMALGRLCFWLLAQGDGQKAALSGPLEPPTSPLGPAPCHFRWPSGWLPPFLQD